MGAGASLALVAHALLVAALVWGVNWRTQTAEVVSAELWAEVPQRAAPPAVEPTTPPPAPQPREATPPKVEQPLPSNAQIAIERERKAKAELEKREEQLRREKLAQAEKEAREKKAVETRLAQQREENLRRMMGQIGGTGSPGSTGTAAQDAAPSRAYAGKLVAHIKPNIVFTETIAGNPAAEVEVRTAASGTIVARRLVKSSGHKDWDDAVLRAIDRTGTLPRDVDGRVPPLLLIAFRPND
jgi:colicin import membrane protein